MVSKVIKKYGKSKSFYWWIGSYVIILILAVALNSIGYFVTLRVLSAEIEKNNSNQIANINIVCDDKFSEILNSTYTLLHINSVERMEREEYSHDAITIGNVSSAISNNVTVYKEVENCAIIYRDRDICFHSDFGKASLSQIYRAYFRGWFDSEDAWLNRTIL